MRTRYNLGRLLATLLLCGCGASAAASDARLTPEVRAVKRAIPAIVNIHSEKTAIDREASYQGGPGRKINGMGTGIIVDERGYIVTNQHVIADVDSLRITLSDNSSYAAHVVSYDRKNDLAVIKINASRELPVAPLGTSSDLMLGERVIAIGNAFGYEHTITSGIVSALHRNVEVNEKQGYRNLIQTDASINPGNSGGPLINLDGNVVGINVAIRAGAQRIGFAIPIDDARVLIARLLNTKQLDDIYHGLVTKDVKSPDSMQLLVNSAEPDSPAARAGFLAGDVIVRAGRINVVDGVDLERAFLGNNAGAKVEVVIRREGAEKTLTVELAPATVAQRGGGTGVPAAPDTVARANNSEEGADDKIWSVLGLKLGSATRDEVQAVEPVYNGGMRVTDVRANSPAAKHGIRAGDILVGLHVWSTLTRQDVTYVVNHPDRASLDPLTFYVIRGRETLYGQLQLAKQ